MMHKFPTTHVPVDYGTESKYVTKRLVERIIEDAMKDLMEQLFSLNDMCTTSGGSIMKLRTSKYLLARGRNDNFYSFSKIVFHI